MTISLPTAEFALAEARPREFVARFTRAGRARSFAARRRGAQTVRKMALLAAALAAPAMAQGQFSTNTFPITTWMQPEAQLAAGRPMGFETPGESFSGSAFYYLADEPAFTTSNHGVPAADRASFALPKQLGHVLDPGPAARPWRMSGTVEDRLRAQQCLTMAIYYEAGAEADAGQRAVAQVVLNRVAHPGYPATVCGVVFQGSQRSTGCQFTFTCDGSMARAPAKMWWDRAARVARTALAGAVYSPVGLATHYHTVQVHPYWADSLDSVGTIGAHQFYRWRGAAGRPTAFFARYLGGEPAVGRDDAAIRSDDPADPLALAQSFSTERMANPTASEATAAVSPVAMTANSAETTSAAQGLTRSGQVRKEYTNAGRWLKQP